MKGKKKKKKKVLVTRFTIVEKKKTFKKKSLSYEHFSAAVVAAFKQNDLQAPACAAYQAYLPAI